MQNSQISCKRATLVKTCQNLQKTANALQTGSLTCKPCKYDPVKPVKSVSPFFQSGDSWCFIVFFSIIAAALHLTPAEQEDVIKRRHKVQRAGGR